MPRLMGYVVLSGRCQPLDSPYLGPSRPLKLSCAFFCHSAAALSPRQRVWCEKEARQS
jgi:hypothetical protein